MQSLYLATATNSPTLEITPEYFFYKPQHYGIYKEKDYFSELPSEIVINILQYLSPFGLPPLMRVNKRMYHLVSAMVYQSPFLYFQEQSAKETTSGRERTKSMSTTPAYLGPDSNTEPMYNQEHGQHQQNTNNIFKSLLQIFTKRKKFAILKSVKSRYHSFLSYLNLHNGQLIRHLDFSVLDKKIQPTQTDLIVLFSVCGQLKTVNLAPVNSLVTDDILELLLNSAYTLTSLNLSNCIHLTHNALDRLSAMIHLKSLTLKETNVTDSSLLQILSQMKYLQKLNVASCQNISPSSLFYIGQYGKKIKWLDIGNCFGLTESGNSEAYWQGMMTIAESCMMLEWLDMSRAKPSRHQQQLQQSDYMNLEGMPDDVLTALVKNCKQLELLDLSYQTELTDASLIAIAKYAPKLKSLSLKSLPRISRVGMLALGDLRKKHKQLIWLQIYNCKQITSFVIDEMIQRLNDGWRKGPYDMTVHREVMDGRSWDSI